MQFHGFLLNISNDRICAQRQGNKDHTFEKAEANNLLFKHMNDNQDLSEI